MTNIQNIIIKIKKLTEMSGASGNEEQVKEYIRKEIKPYVDKIEVDSIGNLIAYKKGKGPKIMLAAHMDEVGLMITHITDKGMLKFAKVGGIDDRVLPAKVVNIGKDKIKGVIGKKAIHLMKKEERNKVVEHTNLYIDIGAGSKEDAEKYVRLGNYVTFDTTFQRNGDIIKGKAFDDRLGCAMLIEVLKEDFPVSIIGAFTVQEELGMRGARVAAYRISPDHGIALEGTAAGDFPEEKDLPRYPKVGAGPVITISDRRLICDKKIVSLFVKIAEDNNILYQFKRPGIGATDSAVIALTKEGVPSGVLATASRYIHSPVGIASIKDIKNGLRLITLVLKHWEKL